MKATILNVAFIDFIFYNLFRAAEKCHKLGNTERMLKAIDSIPNVGDRVEFLEKKGYVKEAARILQDNSKKVFILFSIYITQIMSSPIKWDNWLFLA